MAVKLLDLAYKDSSIIAINSLDKRLPDFNDKTAIEIAHIARNKFFIAHTICQKWLDKRWRGKLQIRELQLGALKIADWLMVCLVTMIYNFCPGVGPQFGRCVPLFRDISPTVLISGHLV